MHDNYDDYESWIRKFFTNSCNFKWVSTHKEEIAKRLPDYFNNNEEHANLALNGLNCCSEILNEIHEYKMVSDLIHLALDSDFLEQGSGTQLELEQHLATAELHRGNLDEAEELIRKGLERINSSERSAELLILYINMIYLEVYRKSFDFDQNRLDEIIRMGYMFNYPKGDIHATVALAYFNQRMDKAMDDAITKATRYYAKETGSQLQTRKIGIARMYFRKAVVLRLEADKLKAKDIEKAKEKADEAQRVLDIASDFFAETNYHMQYVSILYETSQIYMDKGELDEALQWIDLAIKEQGDHHDSNPYYYAMLQHGKGRVLYYRGDYRIAALYFWNASNYWENMKNVYNHALSLNALGSIQIELNQLDDAIIFLKLARALCEKHENNINAKELIETIDENINTVHNKLDNS